MSEATDLPTAPQSLPNHIMLLLRLYRHFKGDFDNFLIFLQLYSESFSVAIPFDLFPDSDGNEGNLFVRIIRIHLKLPYRDFIKDIPFNLSYLRLLSHSDALSRSNERGNFLEKILSREQCDQIWRIFLTKIVKMFGELFCYFERPDVVSKTAVDTLWASFGKNWATFNSDIWSGVCDSVGRAVTPITRVLQFESSNRQNLY